MAHLHEVRDTDKHFVIDPVTMEITTDSQKLRFMQGDHNSEIFTFEMPKVIEGHDMTLCNRVEIHYNDISSDKLNASKDFHKVEDMSVAEDDPEKVIFSWLVHENATKYAGALSFRIKFGCFDNGEWTYKKHTHIYKVITISDGFDNAEAVAEEYANAIAEWEAEVDALEARISSTVQSVNGVSPDENGNVDIYTGAETFEVTVTDNGDGTYTASHRAYDISTAAREGKTVTCRIKMPTTDLLGDKIFHLVRQGSEISTSVLFVHENGNKIETINIREVFGAPMVNVTSYTLATEEYVDGKVATGGGGVSSWNDLTDKPFGDLEELLPVTTFQFDSSMGLFFTPGTIDFRYGETYFVNWNGVEYTTVATIGFFPDSMSGRTLPLVVLGNPVALGGANNELPFAIACTMGVTGAIPLDGSTAVTASISATKKLDAYWIDGPYVLNAEVQDTDINTGGIMLAIDTTELAMAILNNRPVHVHLRIGITNNGIVIGYGSAQIFTTSISVYSGDADLKEWILTHIDKGRIATIPLIRLDCFYLGDKLPLITDHPID